MILINFKFLAVLPQGSLHVGVLLFIAYHFYELVVFVRVLRHGLYILIKFNLISYFKVDSK